MSWQGDLIISSCASYFAGKGYYVNTNFAVPGTEIILDAAAAMPRMRELKARLRKGFAPTGILNHLIEREWVTLDDIAKESGYPVTFVGRILEEAAGDDWIEFNMGPTGPRARITNYRTPAKECVLFFLGAAGFEEKMENLRKLEGCFSRAFFVFPYAIDDAATEKIVSKGIGVLRYYQQQGIFQETVPSDHFRIDKPGCFAKLVEKILYDNMWILSQSII
jgi:hypothetical protein